jgi:hypothetical protein
LSFLAHDANFSLKGHCCNFALVASPSFKPCPFAFFYYQFERTFVLDRALFAHALAITPHLFSNGLFGMVYEHMSNCFILEDSSSRFFELFKVAIAIACGDISRLVALVLGTSRLLAITKNLKSLRPIVVGKMFF